MATGFRTNYRCLMLTALSKPCALHRPSALQLPLHRLPTMHGVHSEPAMGSELAGKNRNYLNSLLRLRGIDTTAFILDSRPAIHVRIFPIVVCNLACLRHCVQLAGSGFCGCPREALRSVLTALINAAELRTCLVSAVYHLTLSRDVCLDTTACQARRSRACALLTTSAAASTAMYQTIKAEEAELPKDSFDESAKLRYQEWRMEHARTNFNVQPGKYREPLLHF
eukprot:1999377-Pleurochrysis_carterae.AAC.8